MSEQDSANVKTLKCIERYPNGDWLIEFTTPKGVCERIIMKSQHERIIRPSEMMPTDEEEDVPPPDYGVRALQ